MGRQWPGPETNQAGRRTNLSGTIMSYTHHTSERTTPNPYSRKSASNTQRGAPAKFTKSEAIGGHGCQKLAKHLRQFIPHRSSRYHRALQDDAGRMDVFLDSIGIHRAPGFNHGMYCRPDALTPDIFADSCGYLIWSTSELPGTLMVVCIDVEGIGLTPIYLADVISMTVAIKFNGSEEAMLAHHLEEHHA